MIYSKAPWIVFVGGENQMTLFFFSNHSFIVLCKLLMHCQLFA